METYASVGHNQVSVWDTMVGAVGRDRQRAGRVGRVGRDGQPLRKRPPNSQWPLTTPWRCCSSSALRLLSSLRGPEAAQVDIYMKPVCMSK